jgi:chemotaxis signal transduction protein
LLLYNAEIPDDGEMVGHNRETGDVYFFLSRYFRLPEQEVHHGIILKDPDRIEDDRNRKIFLVTTVEKIEDIPSEDIKRLPGILKGMEGSSFLTGVRFQGPFMTLFVDPVRLMLHTLDSNTITILEEAEEEG